MLTGLSCSNCLHWLFLKSGELGMGDLVVMQTFWITTWCSCFKSHSKVERVGEGMAIWREWTPDWWPWLMWSLPSYRGLTLCFLVILGGQTSWSDGQLWGQGWAWMTTLNSSLNAKIMYLASCCTVCKSIHEAWVQQGSQHEGAKSTKLISQ